MIYTLDISNYGIREMEEACALLKAYCSGNDAIGSDSNELDSETLTVGFNPDSGYVFLTDECFNTYMLNSNDELEKFHSLPYCGDEGFYEDLMDYHNLADLNKEDVEYLLANATTEEYESQIEEYLKEGW